MKDIKTNIGAFCFAIGFIMIAVAVGEGDAGIMTRIGVALTGFGLMFLPWVLRMLEE